MLHELFTTLHISNSIPIMFKHYVILIFVFLGLWSCAKKGVELPIIPVSGTTEIANHSQIWVFLNFDEKKMKASVNKNNTISTTHWIINIDNNRNYLLCSTKIGCTKNISTFGKVFNSYFVILNL